MVFLTLNDYWIRFSFFLLNHSTSINSLNLCNVIYYDIMLGKNIQCNTCIKNLLPQWYWASHLDKKKISAAACIVALKFFLYCEWKIYMQAPYCLFFTYNYLYDCNMSICTGRYLLFGYISVIFTNSVFLFSKLQCFSFRNKSVV